MLVQYVDRMIIGYRPRKLAAEPLVLVADSHRLATAAAGLLRASADGYNRAIKRVAETDD